MNDQFGDEFTTENELTPFNSDTRIKFMGDLRLWQLTGCFVLASFFLRKFKLESYQN